MKSDFALPPRSGLGIQQSQYRVTTRRITASSRIALARVHPAVKYVTTHPGTALHSIARRADFSPFHLHRVFSRFMGETPKGFSSRLDLERAATLLLSTRNFRIQKIGKPKYSGHYRNDLLRGEGISKYD